MASDGNGDAFDETIPPDSLLISDIPVEIREVKAEVQVRLSKEHVAFDDGSVGGEHKQGSGISYYQATAPTKRPDGTTPLDTNDRGRQWLKSTDGHIAYWDGTAWQDQVVTVIGQVADGLLTSSKMATGFTSGIYPYACVTDQKALGTDAGTLTSGSFAARTLNSIKCDHGSIIIALAANQITLNAGTYRVRASSPGYQVNNHQVRFRDATNSITIAYGTNTSAPSGVAVTTRSECEVEFTVGSDNTLFQLEQRVQTTQASTGGGINGNFGGAEVYSVVELWKLL